MNKKLVAYFSHRGENYSRGKIVNLEKGNTEKVAEMIAKITQADMFEIRAEKEYPYDYNKCVEVAKNELKANSRPKLKEDLDIEKYDTIFLAYPNWWGTIPMPVFSFLEKKDFSNKILLPLCTHEGSGLGSSENDIKNMATGAIFLRGLAIIGSDVDRAENKIKSWIREVLK